MPDAARRRTSGWGDWLEAREADSGLSGAAALERIASRVIDRAGLRAGEMAADLGSGTGLIALRAARAVGPTGRVTAIDADAGCLAELATRARALGLSNVVISEGRLEELPVGSGTLDAALCRSALSYASSLPGAVAEIERVLRDGGRFSIFEPLLGELTWDGSVGDCDEEFRAMELALKSAGGPRSLDRSALRGAFSGAGLEFESLVVHQSLGMSGADPGGLVDDYLHDLPGVLSAFTVLRYAGFTEERIVEVVRAFGKAASAGEVRGRLPCLFLWGSKGA